MAAVPDGVGDLAKVRVLRVGMQERMKVIGIDFSTLYVDLVTLDYDHPDKPGEHLRFPLAGSDAFDRTRCVVNAMPHRSSVVWDDTLAIGIEDPRGPNAGRLLRLQGAVLACLPTATLVYPYVPARWRVLSGLKGHALKSEVAARSVELGAPEWWVQDAHDAHLIARALIADLGAQEKAA